MAKYTLYKEKTSESRRQNEVRRKLTPNYKDNRKHAMKRFKKQNLL